MANDPRFDSRLLAQGTTQAELIYNELIARQAAAFMSLKSRTTNAPPGSPAEFDAYHVPAEGSGLWASFIGEIAVYVDGWKYMTPRPGMRMYVEDEGVTIDWHSPVQSGKVISGHYTIATVSDNVSFRPSTGVSADVVLTGNGLLKIPVGMVPGRIYTLWIKQPAAGGPYTLTYEATGWMAPSAMALTATLNAVDVYTFVGGNSTYPATEISRNLNVAVQ